MDDDSNLLVTLRERVVAAGALRRVASQESVVTSEALLGFPIEAFLRRVYLEVADGGVGPGAAGALPISGSADLATTYLAFRREKWPAGLLPVWDWGDAIWSCTDSDGRIVTHDDVGPPTMTRFTMRSWLRAWLAGVDLWSELYQAREATIINPFTREPVVTKVRGVARGLPWPPPS